MPSIGPGSSAQEIAALVSQALEAAGIQATLSGGGAVSIYSANEYESMDLDFVTLAGTKEIQSAIAPLGFRKADGARQFDHALTDYYVEFPPGPLAFGETVVADRDAVTIETEYGRLRIVTPTQSIMDRLAAYVHWHDNPSFDQAIMVARKREVDWAGLYGWADAEGIGRDLIDRLRALADAGS